LHSLCDDWLVCADTTQRWRSVDGSLAQSRRSEYRTLMAALEREMVVGLKCVADPTEQDALVGMQDEPSGRSHSKRPGIRRHWVGMGNAGCSLNDL
jgi:hypothetical protein